MSEWWTYRLHDFLMFSPAAYWRLFETVHREQWPLHLPAFALGGVVFVAARWPRWRAAGLLALALGWGWVAWGYLHSHYASIHWAADGIAVAFGIQALLFALAAARPGRDIAGGRGPGVIIVAAAWLLHPLAASLQGRPWVQAEVFAIAPDPTVLATIGALLAFAPAQRAMRAALWPVPVLWSLYSSATLWMMDQPQALWLPAVLGAALLHRLLGRKD